MTCDEGRSTGRSTKRPRALRCLDLGFIIDTKMPITASEGSLKFATSKPDLDDLIKRRFFFRQAFEIYGGVGGFWTYGPPGAAVKQNLIALWRKHFIVEENLLEVDDTNIMPYDVLKTSGHVDRFSDFIVKDSKDPNIFFRADKLLEDVMDARMAAKETTPELKQEYQKVKNQADAYSKDELWVVFQKYQIKSPDTGNDLTEPVAFNLMFPTPIGPSGMLQGFLRPETAQGIFLNFKFCLEQNAGQIPFGVAQIGKAFRNEIAPRGGLIRQREFTQAEIEFFCKPGDKPHPKFAGVASLAMQLHPHQQQLAGEGTVTMTLGEAVAQRTIANETLGYFIARTFLFLVRAGCLAEHIRFRQHLPDEMAHYAADCWDAEIEMSLGWVECVGIADRSAYDLTCHGKATKTSLTAQVDLDKPITIESYALTKKAEGLIGKQLKGAGPKVKEYLQGLDEATLKALVAKAEADGAATVSVDGEDFSLSKELLECESKTETKHVEVFVPNVVEPSFGIDRIMAAIFEHTFYTREAEGGDAAAASAPPTDDGKKKKKGKEEGSDDKQKPNVLGFPAEIAPYKAVILPIQLNLIKDNATAYAAALDTLRTKLTDNGLQYKVDESGASIGRRYARADELGIPYAVTIDFDTLGKSDDPSKAGTVTLRDRDSTSQVRLPLTDVADTLTKLSTAHPLTFADLMAAYGTGSLPAATPAAPAGGASGMLEYFAQHGLTAKLNAAVNALGKEKPDDPIAFLVAALQKM